jgi:hypothetical protein
MLWTGRDNEYPEELLSSVVIRKVTLPKEEMNRFQIQQETASVGL